MRYNNYIDAGGEALPKESRASIFSLSNKLLAEV